MATVIQVEQKWKFSKNSVAWYQITRIDGDSAWGVYPLSNGAMSGECLVSYLNQDGTSQYSNWDQDWTLISSDKVVVKVPTHSPVKATQLPDELDFFKRSTTPGNCPCGMIRSECSYHKD